MKSNEIKTICILICIINACDVIVSHESLCEGVDSHAGVIVFFLNQKHCGFSCAVMFTEIFFPSSLVSCEPIHLQSKLYLFQKHKKVWFFYFINQINLLFPCLSKQPGNWVEAWLFAVEYCRRLSDLKTKRHWVVWESEELFGSQVCRLFIGEPNQIIWLTKKQL